MKKIFFTPKIYEEPHKGMGWVEIDEDVVKRIGIRHIYKSAWYGGHSEFVGPDGTKFQAYADNPYAYGGRHKRRFTVHSHGEAVLLLGQKKLTIDAVLHFIRSWADTEATVVTPGKRTINLRKEKSDTLAYVYFILNQDSKAVKIGFAKDVQKRLAALQTSSPNRLKILGSIKTESCPTAKFLERSLHQKFANLHINGEWFRVDAVLLDYIRAEVD
jgi:T5orf172 domain